MENEGKEVHFDDVHEWNISKLMQKNSYIGLEMIIERLCLWTQKI
jgi:hypothetical protein